MQLADWLDLLGTLELQGMKRDLEFAHSFENLLLVSLPRHGNTDRTGGTANHLNACFTPYEALRWRSVSVTASTRAEWEASSCRAPFSTRHMASLSYQVGFLKFCGDPCPAVPCEGKRLADCLIQLESCTMPCI